MLNCIDLLIQKWFHLASYILEFIVVLVWSYEQRSVAKLSFHSFTGLEMSLLVQTVHEISRLE